MSSLDEIKHAEGGPVYMNGPVHKWPDSAKSLDETLQQLANLIWSNADTEVVNRGVADTKAQIKAWVAEKIIGADVPHADSHVFTCDTLKDDFGKYANKCNCGKAEKLLLIAEQRKRLEES